MDDEDGDEGDEEENSTKSRMDVVNDEDNSDSNEVERKGGSIGDYNCRGSNRSDKLPIS